MEGEQDVRYQYLIKADGCMECAFENMENGKCCMQCKRNGKDF